MKTYKSVFAPDPVPDPAGVEGVSLSVAAAGVKYARRTDVLLASFAEGTQVAGVFTQSKCASAPVDWCRANLGGGEARALVVNSGNANAFTGQNGINATKAVGEAAANALKCAPGEVFQSSTGVIGEPLPHERITGAMEDLVKWGGQASIADAARAIMTTDAFPKIAERTAKIAGVEVRLVGIAKGAGMIAPDMATMLSYVFTDAAIFAPVLQAALSKAVGTSFNAITVDSDTSTSDTLMVFATGAATKRGAPAISAVGDRRLGAFKKALTSLLTELAQLVVKDGEGATKFIEVEVKGAKSTASARRIALSVANSPLVKTAMAGEDANWGRIVMAVGKAGEPADRDKMSVQFGDILVAENGARAEGYDEAAASAYMKNRELKVTVSVGVGNATFTAWTCDFNKTYIEINGDYRS
jgi:glutamate N-acetyltransferase / amino-acid N-acetyltransferase